MSSHADSLRLTIRQYVPNGFRDEYGNAHSGPHQREALAHLDALVVGNQRLRGALTEIDTFPISEELSAGYHFAEVRSIARAALRGTP